MQSAGIAIEEINSSYEIGAFSSLLLLQLIAYTSWRNEKEPISI
jgi:hypothetical protein